jgi:hypothetical protein
MARKKIIISEPEFKKLCAMQCTELEIAGFFECSDETLNTWCKTTYGKTFKEIFAIFREGGKASLRRTQWKLAETNAAMSIFLGKQYLDQTDDPKKYAKNDTIEDKVGRYLDLLTDNLASSADDNPGGDDDDE